MKQNNHSFNLCNWGYDMHFDFTYSDVADIDGRWGYLHLKKGEIFNVSYKMQLLIEVEAKKIEQKANFQILQKSRSIHLINQLLQVE